MNHFNQHKNQELVLFRFLLDEVIKGKNDSFKLELKSILQETHELTTGQKNYFQINRNYYSLIVFLSRADETFFKTPKENPNKKTYEKVKTLLSVPYAENAFG
jgi:hypothetical protein